MDYMKKYEDNPFEDVFWNIPEQKQGTVAIVGGNSQSFLTLVKTAEFLSEKYPVKTVRAVLPVALKGKIPPNDNISFVASTESGTFADGEMILSIINESDSSIIIGDLSKNSITEKAIRSAVENSDRPLIVTRDAVDITISNGMEKLLLNNNLVFLASMAQLQKLFRAIYYPKVLLLSQSLLQVADALHKFTLSYPAKIVTLHNGQILVAGNGEVSVVPMDKTNYTAISFWNGELASKIAAMNLFTPNNFTKATVAAIFAD